MIRCTLVDHARQKSAARGRGIRQPDPLGEAVTIAVQADIDTLLLDRSPNELVVFDSRKSQVVEMRFFDGLSAKDTAILLVTSEGTVRRDWNIARAWLYRRMQGEMVP